MREKKILTVIGARPQFVKAAALSRELSSNTGIKEILVHTGQHFDANMSDIFFEEMGIPKPQHRLQVSGLNHGAMTGRMMEQLEEIVLLEKPDAILVYGDTNSTLAGALVGVKLHIPVIHVEAGLRSFNMKMPEEINRILTDRVSSLLFCPTAQAVENLRREGYDALDTRYELVGDIMEDVALFFKSKALTESRVLEEHRIKGDFLVMTCHRPENTDNVERLQEIINGVNEIASKIQVVWPVHPRLRIKLAQVKFHERVSIIDPVGYLDMIKLLDAAKLVMTDSGGLQKEAYFFNKFCITLRNETEWIELVHGGFNFLTGADAKKIISAFHSIVGKSFIKSEPLYGGGVAARRISQSLKSFFHI